ncbi:MAG: KTSC domain-containing protein [Verrucomicrobia bacterium]|nr:KTSC domain-containing protein [Cytophagales bacterium]
MKRQSVNSSMIASIGYDLEEETMEVEFVNGGEIYQYFDVPYGIYHAFMEADSKGEFMREEIMDKYDFSKVKIKRR